MSVLVLDNIVIPCRSDCINELVGGDDVIIWREFRTVVIQDMSNIILKGIEER